jgi:N6-adenosine-specific RNA methylase IME4
MTKQFDESANTVHGRLLEAVHISGYSSERACGELEWLLDDDRWKTVGTGFDDINAFLATIDLSEFRVAIEQRKKLTKRLKELEATQRATAEMLGVGKTTVFRDLDDGPNGPQDDKKSSEINSGEIDNGPSGPPSAAWFQDDIDAPELHKKKVAAEQRKKNKTAKIHLVSSAVFSSNGPFGTVVIDPPWQVEKIDREVRPNQDAFDYPVMSVDNLVAYWHKELATRIEPDCHLFMWTTQKWLPATIELMPKIGFRYVLAMVWHKPGGFQPIGLPQYNCEFVIYAHKGAPVFIDTKEFNCCFAGDRREHSRKPDEFYDVIRRVTGGSRIDVFSREQRDGFAQYGNEIAKFNSEAAE